MSDSTKTIKVVDRRMFTSDGEIREEIRAEMEAADPAGAAHAANAAETVDGAGGAKAGGKAPEPDHKPPPEEPAPVTSQAFLRLLDMLAQTASLYLEGVPDPATGRRHVELNGARQIVESLLALREKTRGQLSFEERDALDGLVGELQMVFARMASSVKPAMQIPHPAGARKRG